MGVINFIMDFINTVSKTNEIRDPESPLLTDVININVGMKSLKPKAVKSEKPKAVKVDDVDSFIQESEEPNWSHVWRILRFGEGDVKIDPDLREKLKELRARGRPRKLNIYSPNNDSDSDDEYELEELFW